MHKLAIFLFLFTASLVHGQQKTDLSLTLNESVLNKTFAAIGEMHGTSPYSFMFFEGTYDWNIFNSKIRLRPNRADFITDVKVTIGSYNYFLNVTGDVEVCYEPTTNLIYIEVERATFPLKMMFLGKERVLWYVDLADQFETPFTFEGPLTTETEFSFEMPDHTRKLIYAHPVNCGVKIAEKQIIVTAELEFVSRPQNTAVK